MAYEVGSVLPFEFRVYDSAGTLITPASISVTVTDPDGLTSTSTPTPSATGVYPVDTPATKEGIWFAVATTTSPNDVSPAQSFYVDATASTVAPVSLADAKEHLRITSTGHDTQLAKFIVAALKAVEDYTGRTWVRTVFTETYDGRGCDIILRHSPVRSVTSVTENGTALTVGSYFLRSDAAILVRGTTTAVFEWAPGTQNISVTYVASPQAVPWQVRHGILETVRELWESQRGNSNMPDGAEFEFATGDVVPRQVRAMLDALRAPGIG